MIRLSGMTEKNKDNPNGDIEITFTGLRKGEKLFEELLIDGAKPTEHERIMRADEKEIELGLLEKYLSNIKEAVKAEDYSTIGQILQETISEYNPPDKKTSV